jgi:hypothetical protein
MQPALYLLPVVRYPFSKPVIAAIVLDDKWEFH